MDVCDPPLASYQLEEPHKKYLFLAPKVYMTTQWLNNAREKHNWNKILKGWETLGNTFRVASQEGYKASKFLKHIQILNALMCQLYGERDTIVLWIYWVPIMVEIVNRGPIFNWGAIISSTLNQATKKIVIIDDKQEAYFFMSSYIMDALCGGQHFLGMNWAWRKGLPSKHIYCLELWEKK